MTNKRAKVQMSDSFHWQAHDVNVAIFLVYTPSRNRNKSRYDGSISKLCVSKLIQNRSVSPKRLINDSLKCKVT